MKVLNSLRCNKCGQTGMTSDSGGFERASFPCFRTGCKGLAVAFHDPRYADVPEPIRNRMSVYDDNLRADIERRLASKPATVAAPLTPLGNSWPRGVLESQLRQLLASQPCKRDRLGRREFRVGGIATLFNCWSDSKGANGNHLFFHENAFTAFLNTGRTVPAVLDHDVRKTIPGKLTLHNLPHGLGVVFTPDLTSQLGVDFAHLVQSGVVKNMSILAQTVETKAHQLDNGERGVEAFRAGIGEVTFCKTGAFSSTVVLGAGHLPYRERDRLPYQQERRRALLA